MVWATSMLPRNGHLPGMDGGREAMADDAHGVDVHKKSRSSGLTKKGGEKEVTWIFRESRPTM